GALGTDAERAAAVEAGERAPARADGMDVDHRDAHGETGDARLGAVRRLVVDQAHVGRRPTHVEGDDAPDPGATRARGRSDDAARRPREDRPYRLRAGGGEADQTTARLHDADAASHRCREGTEVAR